MTGPGTNGKPMRIAPRPEEPPPYDGPDFSDTAPPGEVRQLLQIGDHVELARILIARLNETAPAVWASGAWFQYATEQGVWGEVRREDIDQMTTEHSGAKVNGDKKPLKIKASDVNGARKVAETLASSPEHFDEALPGIAFSNGFAMVSESGVQLCGHSAAHRARWSYPFAFEAREDCGFRQFLLGCFMGDDDAEAKVQILREFIGACIIGRAAGFQLALVLVGEGSNGKGVAMTAIEGCMPPGSVIAVPPQKMGQEYYKARIAGKLLNVVSELPEADIIDSDAFKAVISGDTIEARNPTERPFSHRPIAGHIYACNRLPGTTDQSNGFWRRFAVLKFGRTFEVDSGFSESVHSDVAGTVCWAVSGVHELLARKRYEMPPSSAQLKRDWRMSSDQVMVFLEEGYEKSPTEWITAKELYGQYKTWATDNGHRPMASNKFGERMALAGHPPRKTERANVYDVKRKSGTEEKPWGWNL